MSNRRAIASLCFVALGLVTGLLLGNRILNPLAVVNQLTDDDAHWLTGVWISTATPSTTLVFLRDQTFVEFAPGYSGSYPTKYRLTARMMFEAAYPRGEEGEATLNRSQFQLADAGQLLIVPVGAFTSKSTKFKRLTSTDPWVAGQNPPKAILK